MACASSVITLPMRPTGSTDALSISRLAVRWRYESSDLTDLTPRVVPLQSVDHLSDRGDLNYGKAGVDLRDAVAAGRRFGRSKGRDRHFEKWPHRTNHHAPDCWQ